MELLFRNLFSRGLILKVCRLIFLFACSSSKSPPVKRPVPVTATTAVLPATTGFTFQGTAQAFASSMVVLEMLILAAILVIYIFPGILYESFIHPLTILSGLPSAGLGALLTLLVFRIDLNLCALVGVIMLVGIVKKNAIMMIDFAPTGPPHYG